MSCFASGEPGTKDRGGERGRIRALSRADTADSLLQNGRLSRAKHPAESSSFRPSRGVGTRGCESYTNQTHPGGAGPERRESRGNLFQGNPNGRVLVENSGMENSHHVTGSGSDGRSRRGLPPEELECRDGRRSSRSSVHSIHSLHNNKPYHTDAISARERLSVTRELSTSVPRDLSDLPRENGPSSRDIAMRKLSNESRDELMVASHQISVPSGGDRFSPCDMPRKLSNESQESRDYISDSAGEFVSGGHNATSGSSRPFASGFNSRDFSSASREFLPGSRDLPLSLPRGGGGGDDSDCWDSSSLSTHDSHGNVTCYRGYTQRKSITSMDPRLPDSDPPSR